MQKIALFDEGRICLLKKVFGESLCVVEERSRVLMKKTVLLSKICGVCRQKKKR